MPGIASTGSQRDVGGQRKVRDALGGGEMKVAVLGSLTASRLDTAQWEAKEMNLGWAAERGQQAVRKGNVRWPGEANSHYSLLITTCRWV